jgi:hypothetical protein
MMLKRRKQGRNHCLMPAALAPWIDDISNRLQCPPDYVAVAAITALGSLIGRRIGIKPQTKRTGWRSPIYGERLLDDREC